MSAITKGFDPDVLARDPACIHIVVLDDDKLAERSHDFKDRHFTAGTVGFHMKRLGADNTVFVTPNEHIPLDTLILHEVLHALSHRFSSESVRRGFVRINEGATDYIARELAVIVLGHKRELLHSDYDDAVEFYRALMARLGKEGTQLLADAYLRDGYDAFERLVDRQLGMSLGACARDLQRRDASSAINRLGRSATR